MTKTDGPYCRDCGNDDKRKLAAIHNPANGIVYRCAVCEHEFLWCRELEDAFLFDGHD